MTSLSNDASVPDTGERLRHVHHIVIGVDRKIVPPYRIDAALRALQDDLTRLTGGITAWIGDGTWTPHAQQSDYAGPIERDAALNIIITLTDEDRVRVSPAIKAAIAHVVLDHDLGCDHIHVMVWPAQSDIFCISDCAENTVTGPTPAVIPANQNEADDALKEKAIDTRRLGTPRL